MDNYKDTCNFEFTVDSHVFKMSGGKLEVDDVEYEEDGCPETYALARAYALLLKNDDDLANQVMGGGEGQ